jgi:hypothetical protein
VRGGPRRGALVVGTAELEVAASLKRSAGVCIASRCGNFGNKLLTKITHAEWLKRIDSGPSPTQTPTARLRRKRTSRQRTSSVALWAWFLRRGGIQFTHPRMLAAKPLWGGPTLTSSMVERPAELDASSLKPHLDALSLIAPRGIEQATY